MTSELSITRRLIFSMLLLELLGGVFLGGVIVVHEYAVQVAAVDSDLRASANSLLGAVQEGPAEDGGVRLELGTLRLPRRAAYQVVADGAHRLATQGDVSSTAGAGYGWMHTRVGGLPFRFFILEGERVVDPGGPAAITHRIRVVYGLPEGRVRHEVWEAARFAALATAAFLALTALSLTWLVRRYLAPVRALALEAAGVNAEQWQFTAPPGSKRFVELRPLASALESAVARLQRAFEQQRRFTSDAAHELKTDLAIIKASVQLLLMRRRSPEEYERGLQSSLQEVVRLESTVARMLTLARMEHSAAGPPRTSDLREIAANTGERFSAYASAAQVAIESRMAGQPALVALSPEDAAELCSNLLMNAIQHCRAEGRVRLAVESRSGEVTLRVEDDGEGIPEGDLPFLFEPFYRADESRSRHKGGTGLGLSICKALCTRAGGSISIRNRGAEGGALVEVRLPSART